MHVETLDRSRMPESSVIEQLSISRPEKYVLKNGIPVYIISRGSQEVCSIDFEFYAGKWYEPVKMAARFSGQMLKEGTASRSAFELSEQLDFHGASLRTGAGNDTASVTLFSINRHLPSVLPLLEEVIKQPSFPGNELDILLTDSKENFRINQVKNEYLADKKFARSLYGDSHPYGYFQAIDDYDAITSSELRNFHRQFYNAQNCFIMVAGKVNDTTVKLLDKYFGGDDWKGSKPSPKEIAPVPEREKKLHEKKKDAFQSAIRIGKLLFNKNHPDFQKMHVLNTILGGYFGSRLMSNIREDKGFTYGIHSVLSSKLKEGHFYIATEVGVDVCSAAVKEIYVEMERLKADPVPADELQLVRNYLSGKVLSSLDGPFRLAETYKSLILYNHDIDYIYNLMETIKTVSAKELQGLAEKYFDFLEMHEVVIG